MIERNLINKNKIHDNQKDLWKLKTMFFLNICFFFPWIFMRNIVLTT
jgi:hypothetical protein